MQHAEMPFDTSYNIFFKCDIDHKGSFMLHFIFHSLPFLDTLRHTNLKGNQNVWP